MRIAQITWITFPNFGTFLQAYALQRTLADLGYESTLIDDCRYTYFAPSFKKTVKGMINWLRRPSRSLRLHKTVRNYRSFADRFLKIDHEWKDTKDLNDKYDAFVCGSDQIWSPLLSNHYSGFYFASFAVSTKKIAYAPSLGTATYTDEYAEMVRPWLAQFSALSVREAVGKPVLEVISGRTDVETVLDPTLLLDAEKWRSLLAESGKDLTRKPYMLVYLLTFNEEYLRLIRQIADRNNLEIVCFGLDERLKPYADEYVTGAGPLEFLNLIDRAEYVVTDSFHGTIFSYQLRRPFLTLKRFRSDSKNNQNSRVENLFGILGIKNHFFGIEELSGLRLPDAIDWQSADIKLQVEREKSLNYLKNALQCQN